MHGAGAPSAPSEEGAGFLRRLRRKKTEGEITRGCGVRYGVDARCAGGVRFLAPLCKGSSLFGLFTSRKARGVVSLTRYSVSAVLFRRSRRAKICGSHLAPLIYILDKMFARLCRENILCLAFRQTQAAAPPLSR